MEEIRQKAEGKNDDRCCDPEILKSLERDDRMDSRVLVPSSGYGGRRLLRREVEKGHG